MKCLMLLLAAAMLTVVYALPHDMEALVRVARQADCGCEYNPGGCRISEAAPKGFKCECVYPFIWTCTGTAKGCSPGEHCPGGQRTIEACRLGGGDCGGYDYDGGQKRKKKPVRPGSLILQKLKKQG